MSLFEKCEVYLNKNNIELDDNDYTPDGRILVDSNDEIRKWDFPIPKPYKEELDKIDDKDIEKLKKKRAKKQKQKFIKNYNIPSLDNEDMMRLEQVDNLLFLKEDTDELYYYRNKKLYKIKTE